MDTVVVALRVALSLAVVLGLLWVLQRRLSRGAGPRSANVVSIVGRQGLGQKASVVVVDVDGRRFVLGVTEQSINVLHGGEAAQEPQRQDDRVDASAAAFARSLHAVSDAPTLVAPAVIGQAAAVPALRPRRDRTPNARLGGSILSPSTWQQTAALLRHGR